MDENIEIRTKGFNTLTLELGGYILDLDIITYICNRLFSYFKDNRKYFVILKLQFEDGSYRTLHQGVIMDNDKLNSYILFINNRLDDKSNYYRDTPIFYAIFDFFMIEPGQESKYTDKWNEISDNETKYLDFVIGDKSFHLPDNMKYFTWGNIIYEDSHLLILQDNDGGVFKITRNDHEYFGEYKKHGNLIVEFLDYPHPSRENCFIREIGNCVFYINVGKISAITRKIKHDYLKPINTRSNRSIKIITFDIETILRDGNMVPYLYSMYDGNRKYSWFTSSPKSLFDQLLRSKYKGYFVYAHNLSNFDSIFILKYIASLRKIYNIKIVRRDGKILEIKIVNREKNISITIRDSLLLLPSSLDKLASQFCPDLPKLQEPVLISSDLLEGNPYVQSTSHYNKEVREFTNYLEWKEAIQTYCERDCESLFLILIKFRDLIYSNWKMNIEDYPTIPSLSFAVYRAHYLLPDQIPLTNGIVYHHLKQSYTGGSTEMYIPKGNNIYCYDVNSLYPYVMMNKDFPIGQTYMFEGNILDFIKPEYWIAEVEVETKSDLFAPTLQIHHKTQAGFRTIAANGKFTMWITSAEYLNSLKDYNIKIIRGYYWVKTDIIFSEYINTLYNLRSKYSKLDPMNLICKLLMNAFYGRFGMKPITEMQQFCSFKDIKLLARSKDIINILKLDDDLFLVTLSDSSKTDYPFKISVGIASAVTSYARIHMSQFKNNPQYNLYYTDTDSIFIDKPLPDYLIGNDIGQFKLEYVLSDAVFLGPKIYAGITNDGQYICKIKGYKNASSVPFEDMKGLLQKDKFLEITHQKWFRHIDLSSITIKSQLYKLVASESKRTIIYKNGEAVNTTAFKLASPEK